MKLRLPFSLKFAILACLSLAASAGAAEFVVDGVNPNDIQHSTRFYDNGKGAYWTETYSTPYKGAEQLYKETGDFSFMGELEGRINAPEKGISVYSFSNLTDDSDTCWYNVSANVLEYWQSTYGVFYNGKDYDGVSRELPTGLNYDKEICPTLGGTQSLKLGTYLYDNYMNAGGDMLYAASWYLMGDDFWGVYYDPVMRTPHDVAGYFADYYADYIDYGQDPVINKFNSSSQHDIDGLSGVSTYVKQAFGTELQADGSYSSGTPGSLLYFGISNDGVGGHALTCYGFKTGNDGNITSVYLTNSDDREYRLMEIFLKEEGGKVYLYTDKECKNRWSFATGSAWYVDQLEWIDTPNALKEMYADYRSGDLVWTGEASEWSQAAADNYNELPTTSSGWKSSVQGKAYDSWYHMRQDARFDDTATGTTVKMYGAIVAGKVTIDNSSKAYTFSGTEGATLDTPELVKSGTNTATFTGVDITAAQVKVGTGALLLGQNASLDINSQVVIKALGSGKAAGISASSGSQTYRMDNTAIRIADAEVEYIANTAGTLSNLLSNVKLVNNSIATLTENNSNNKSGISAHAAKGSIQFLNKGTQGIQLTDAIIGTNLSLSVYKGTTVSEAEESALYIQGKLVGLTNSTINANLTMMEGSELDVSGTENTGINLGSALTFNLGMTLSEADVNAVLGMNEGGAYHLFNSVDSITLASSGYSNWTQAITVEDAVDASTYFTNLEQGKYFITYTGGANVGQVMLMGATVPEPATGTLSLLALAALAARRRRK